MAVILPSGRQSFITPTGLPLVGGRVYTYAAGTSTPLPTYADAAQTVPNTNPVVLDARGEATIFWLGTYKIVLRDALDNLIYSVDDVVAAPIDTTLRTDLAFPTGALLLGFKEAGAGGIDQTVDAFLKRLPISPKSLGAVWDGFADDTEAIQRTIDAANAQGRPILWPEGTATISAPIDMRGRAVIASGIPGKTTIKAAAAMAVMFNVEETGETYFTPFELSNLYLDGNNLVTNANISIVHRHGYDLSSIWSFNTFRAFREKDCFLARHWNLRTGTCQIGFHSEGSNHSSQYYACSAVGCAATGILIEANGSVPDGNHALLWSGCDVEFGEGVGVSMTANTSALFEGCYLGENIEKAVFLNTGGVAEIIGGWAFFGYKTQSVLVRAAGPGGRTKFRFTRISGQEFGTVGFLAYATDPEITAGAGKASFIEIDGEMPIGGDPVLFGDLLDHGPQQEVFAPRWGRLYAGSATDATFALSSDPLDDPNILRITCTGVTGPNPRIRLYQLLMNNFWRSGEPLYLATVYRSTKAATVSVVDAPGGTTLLPIGLAPIAGTIRTYIKLDPIAQSIVNGILQYEITPTVGDYFELRKVFFSDSTMHKQCEGQLGALYAC